MDFNSENSEMQEQETLPEEQQSLTSAEMELLLAKKRDNLYRNSAVAAAVFFAAAVVLMASFKLNEDFFDASSRFGMLMDSVNAQEQNSAYPKINIKAAFLDKAESKLVIPLDTVEDSENITVREEFTKNKLIITLEGASEYINDGIELTSDSRIMDAVGIYRQNLNVVVEVYCKEMYSYAIAKSGQNLTINFMPVRNNYDMVAVVYIPYEDRTRLELPEWHKSLEKYVSDKRIRLFMASDMQEPYTEQEVAAFAESIKADVVLGIDVTTDAQAQQTSASVICNTTYFMPDFNSAQLSIIFAEELVSKTQIKIQGFEEAEKDTPLVYMASRPAAMIKISQSQKDADSVETVYKLNERLVEVIKNMLGSISAA